MSKTKQELETKQQKEERAAKRAAPEWPGLQSISDGESARRFVGAVEDAFEALHQPAAGLGGPDDPPDATVSPDLFRDWAKTVDDRMEGMGLQRARLETADAPNAPIGDLAVVKWTKSIWHRFAALGQILPDPVEA